MTRLLRARALAVRGGGVAGCLAAYFAIGAVARVDAAAPRLALAAIGFLCGSLGSALLWLGDHVFDRVAVSDRWRRQRSTPPPDRRV
ncbi:hypothetical protein PX554_00895 [Sphingomonas sp. H39-1-10]|uniref:hypothetical protein n=1 Tax=Sphingomonas pollutisoli TaxID=3030829 RepID=UPI0023B99268|nr:hypothetical protein [Sphingomonas pollutisoli]MDF0486671.1 hypothetical protein [Sphingomonas pollutisoli]